VNVLFFFKFITDGSWSIVFTDVLVKRNGARDEETKESAIVYLASRAMSLASQEYNDMPKGSVLLSTSRGIDSHYLPMFPTT